MKNVFYHNAMDVLSMVSLLNGSLSPADHLHRRYPQASWPLGRMQEDLGDIQQSGGVYRQV
jgi:hypothetical protein